MKSRREHITIIAPNLSGRGGTETVLTKVINHAHYERDIDFKLFLSDGTLDKKWLTQLKIPKKNIILNYSQGLMKVIKKINFLIFNNDDVILALGPKTVALARIIRIFFFKKYKIVSWIHFSLENGPVKHAGLLKLADQHLAISTGIVDQLVSIGVSTKKIYKIYNPVERQPSVISVSKDNIRRIIYVGRLTYYGQKNLQLLINSLANLPQDKKYKIDFYGDGDDALKIKKLCMDILSENITVYWHGWVADPWDSITEADILVLSSTYEGFGMVLAEAISRGLPVVSTDVPVGPNDIIKDYENGFLVELDNVNEFAKKIDYAIEYFHNKDKAEIKKSISHLYSEAYYSRLSYAFLKILND